MCKTLRLIFVLLNVVLKFKYVVVVTLQEGQYSI